jgi:hypothetical protein
MIERILKGKELDKRKAKEAYKAKHKIKRGA